MDDVKIFRAGDFVPVQAVSVADYKAALAREAASKYKAELYDEVWQKATGMGFMNVTMALEQVAALREELATSKRVGPPHFCGLPMSLNPHPEAGVPGRFLEVGTVSECIPCLVASRHGWAKTASDLQQRLTAAEQRNAELVELLDSAFFRLDTFIEAEREMPVPSMEVLRDAILRHCPTLKPVEPGPIHVDCGECPNITDGCHGTCMKAKPTESGASE